jgi:hypothetical protein
MAAIIKNSNNNTQASSTKTFRYYLACSVTYIPIKTIEKEFASIGVV